MVDLDTGKTLATPYAVSADQGATWHRGLTGFLAQTTKTIELPDGRILAVYRRNDEPGLWATTARLDGDAWVNEETVALWRGQSSGMTGDTNPGEELAQLKFGFPQMVLEPDGARLPRLLVRGGLHQEHPLAADRRRPGLRPPDPAGYAWNEYGRSKTFADLGHERLDRERVIRRGRTTCAS